MAFPFLLHSFPLWLKRDLPGEITHKDTHTNTHTHARSRETLHLRETSSLTNGLPGLPSIHHCPPLLRCSDKLYSQGSTTSSLCCLALFFFFPFTLTTVYSQCSLPCHSALFLFVASHCLNIVLFRSEELTQCGLQGPTVDQWAGKRL